GQVIVGKNANQATAAQVFGQKNARLLDDPQATQGSDTQSLTVVRPQYTANGSRFAILESPDMRGAPAIESQTVVTCEIFGPARLAESGQVIRGSAQHELIW